MYDFAAEPGNNELTVSEGEIITITNPVREIKQKQGFKTVEEAYDYLIDFTKQK